MDKKKTKSIIIILLILFLLSSFIAVWALFFRKDKVLVPDHAIMDEDKNQSNMENDNDKVDYEEGQNNVSLTYSTSARINLTEKFVELYFSNPSKSNQDILLQLIIQDNVVAQSGLIKTGNKITRMSLIEGNGLIEGGYDGILMVYYYHEDTGEKSILNTKIPIQIEVYE